MILEKCEKPCAIFIERILVKSLFHEYFEAKNYESWFCTVKTVVMKMLIIMKTLKIQIQAKKRRKNLLI